MSPQFLSRFSPLLCVLAVGCETIGQETTWQQSREPFQKLVGEDYRISPDEGEFDYLRPLLGRGKLLQGSGNAPLRTAATAPKPATAAQRSTPKSKAAARKTSRKRAGAGRESKKTARRSPARGTRKTRGGWGS